MKAIFILCIAFAIAYPAQGLFLDSISSVISTTQNVLNTVQTGINTAQFLGEFLWDNAFGPSWELFLSGGADFIDTYFGGILNAVGKKREAEVRLQLSLVHQLFLSELNGLVNNFHSLFQQFVNEALNMFTGSLVGILFGVVTINDVFGAILTKFKTYIQQAVQQTFTSLSGALTNLGPEAAQLVGFVQQQIQSAGALFQNELNALSSFAINFVNGGLAYLYNNFGDLIAYYESKVSQFLSDATAIITSSLVGLLFGTLTMDGLIGKLVNKLTESVVDALQYTFSYASTHLSGLYVQFQPFIQQALTFVQQLNIPMLNNIVSLGQQIVNTNFALPINFDFIGTFLNSALVNLLG